MPFEQKRMVLGFRMTKTHAQRCIALDHAMMLCFGGWRDRLRAALQGSGAGLFDALESIYRDGRPGPLRRQHPDFLALEARGLTGNTIDGLIRQAV